MNRAFEDAFKDLPHLELPDAVDDTSKTTRAPTRRPRSRPRAEPRQRWHKDERKDFNRDFVAFNCWIDEMLGLTIDPDRWPYNRWVNAELVRQFVESLPKDRGADLYDLQ